MPKAKQADRKNNKQESIEATLWQSADKLRKNMDAAEYKHVVLGLIFLKYISDAFEVLHSKLVKEKAEGADPEDPKEYSARLERHQKKRSVSSVVQRYQATISRIRNN